MGTNQLQHFSDLQRQEVTPCFRYKLQRKLDWPGDGPIETKVLYQTSNKLHLKVANP